MTRKAISLLLFIFLSLPSVSFAACVEIGAFLSDEPNTQSIENFKKDFGKQPYQVMVFIAWGDLLKPKVIQDVYAQGSVLFVAWEPWEAASGRGIEFDALLAGKQEDYIRKFADQLKGIPGKVYLRFAHEANGDWYPWSADKIGKDQIIDIQRYVHRQLKDLGVKNVSWVYSVNAWDSPKQKNGMFENYPGDEFVDVIGLDGYDWGPGNGLGRWASFEQIFMAPYQEFIKKYNKPIMISEFSTAGGGTYKAQWIEKALESMETMDRLQAVALFNVDKEKNWAFSSELQSGQSLKQGLSKAVFSEIACSG